MEISIQNHTQGKEPSKNGSERQQGQTPMNESESAPNYSFNTDVLTAKLSVWEPLDVLGLW